MTNFNDCWTEQRTELLCQYWHERYSASQIANKLGRTTRNAVIGKARRLGLDHRTTANKSSRPKPIVDLRLKPRPRPRPQRMRPMTEEQVIEPTAVALSNPVTLFNLKAEHCRWPLWGEDDPAEKLFCGAVKPESSPYCAFHARKAFVRPKNFVPTKT